MIDMALAWFICPYKVKTDPDGTTFRYCAMDDFSSDIFTDSGTWTESEILGDVAVVKVRASNTTLNSINNASGFIKIPNHVNLNDTLSDLTSNQRTAILNKLNSLGYTNTEIANALGDNLTSFRTKTLRQLLIFASSRRLKPFRILNGVTEFTSEVVIPRSIEDVNNQIT